MRKEADGLSYWVWCVVDMRLGTVTPLVDEVYELGAELGHGTYGKVYRAIRRADRRPVAVKLVKLTEADGRPGCPIAVMRELFAVSDLRHRNIMGLQGVARPALGTGLYMEFELMHCDVRRAFRVLRRLTVGEARSVTRQMLRGLAHMHANGVAHRDLKPENMLLSRDGVVKIADLGMSRKAPTDGNMTALVVTLWYRPPELLEHGLRCDEVDCRYDGAAVDVWSAGCIMWEMLTGEVAFRGSANTDLQQLDSIHRRLGSTEGQEADGLARMMESLKERDRDGLCGGAALDLLASLLRLDPGRRATSADALNHAWLCQDDADDECEIVARMTNGIRTV